MFPPKGTSNRRKVAEGYEKSIRDMCAAASPSIRCLNAKISMHPAYPESFFSKEPLPFSINTRNRALIKELQELASELGLAGGVK